MSSASATPPATRRIARSYLHDLIASTPLPPPGTLGAPRDAIVEHLLERSVRVRHVLKTDQLVLTFDLADDPAAWSTAKPAADAQGTAAGLDGQVLDVRNPHQTSAADSEAHAVPAADPGRAD